MNEDQDTGLTPEDTPMVRIDGREELCMTPRAMLVMLALMKEGETNKPSVWAFVQRFQRAALPAFEAEKLTRPNPRSLATFLDERFGGAEVAAQIHAACTGAPTRDLFDILTEVLDKRLRATGQA